MIDIKLPHTGQLDVRLDESRVTLHVQWDNELSPYAWMEFELSTWMKLTWRIVKQYIKQKLNK